MPNCLTESLNSDMDYTMAIVTISEEILPGKYQPIQPKLLFIL